VLGWQLMELLAITDYVWNRSGFGQRHQGPGVMLPVLAMSGVRGRGSSTMADGGRSWSGLEQATATQVSDLQPFSWHLEIAKNRRIKILPMMASRSISPCGRRSGAASAHLFHQLHYPPPPAQRFPRSIRRLDTALTPSSAGNTTKHNRF